MRGLSKAVPCVRSVARFESWAGVSTEALSVCLSLCVCVCVSVCGAAGPFLALVASSGHFTRACLQVELQHRRSTCVLETLWCSHLSCGWRRACVWVGRRSVSLGTLGRGEGRRALSVRSKDS